MTEWMFFGFQYNLTPKAYQCIVNAHVWACFAFILIYAGNLRHNEFCVPMRQFLRSFSKLVFPYTALVMVIFYGWLWRMMPAVTAGMASNSANAGSTPTVVG